MTTACEIALRLVAAFRDHVTLPSVRAGLAWGDVLARDGDCFGPTVNLAARITSCAQPDEALVDVRSATLLDQRVWEVEPLGAVTLKGIASPISIARISR